MGEHSHENANPSRTSPQHSPQPASGISANEQDSFLYPQGTFAVGLAANILQLQRTYGNQMVQRLLAQRAPAIQRDPDPAPAAETEAEEEEAESEATDASIWQPIIDGLVQQTIEAELERFEQIPARIRVGEQPLAEGDYGPPTPIWRDVTIHAAYFINTETAREHYGDRRRTARFNSIRRTLSEDGFTSVLTGGHGRERSSGTAVALGKATPEDIRRFVEEAAEQGVLLRFARSAQGGSVLTATQELADLDEAALQRLVQAWVYHVGAGVDCSGFVQQVLIRVQEELQDISTLAMGGEMPVPEIIGAQERSARSFREGDRVASPAELRPGDAWVVSDGGHVRIVSSVREATDEAGNAYIEFETAESSGDSTTSEPGAIGRTWRTGSTTRFAPIQAVGHTASPRGGTFHRILQY